MTVLDDFQSGHVDAHNEYGENGWHVSMHIINIVK